MSRSNNRNRRTVDVGLMPAQAMYRSLQRMRVSWFITIHTHSFPMLMGKPFAPRSPSPRIREPPKGMRSRSVQTPSDSPSVTTAMRPSWALGQEASTSLIRPLSWIETYRPSGLRQMWE